MLLSFISHNNLCPCKYLAFFYQYFQVNYTEENLLDYIDPNNDTLMVRLANGRLCTECRVMVGTDKRATITTNWSEFRRRANIREGDICAFRFRITSKRRLVLTVHRL